MLDRALIKTYIKHINDSMLEADDAMLADAIRMMAQGLNKLATTAAKRELIIHYKMDFGKLDEEFRNPQIKACVMVEVA